MNSKAFASAVLVGLVVLLISGCAPEEQGVASESGNIVVYEPSPGDTVSSPLAVSGIARVFEANVLIRIRDEDGSELAFTFTTATEAGPEFGDFYEEVPYELRQGAQQGTVEVFSQSAKTGEEIDMVRIPVRLQP